MDEDQRGRAAERLVDDAARGRFELYRGEDLAGWLRYTRLRPNRYALRHTEVDPAHRGRGIAGAMVTRVLEEIRCRGGTVTAICPYVVDFMSRTPAFADLVDPRHPGYTDRVSAEQALGERRE